MLSQWEASRRRGRGSPDDADKRKRALGLLNWRCFVGGSRTQALAQVGVGTPDVETNAALRYLAPLVNEGDLTREELADAIVDASQRNRLIPDNKGRWQVEADIDRALSKFGEPFDWDRLDNDG